MQHLSTTKVLVAATGLMLVVGLGHVRADTVQSVITPTSTVKSVSPTPSAPAPAAPAAPAAGLPATEGSPTVETMTLPGPGTDTAVLQRTTYPNGDRCVTAFAQFAIAVTCNFVPDAEQPAR